MGHTRAEVLGRARAEFRLLDRLVGRLSPAQWRLPVPRSETKDPWTIKDTLAHITHWREGVLRAARHERAPAENRLGISAGNRVIYKRWRSRPAREVLAWHRQVQKELLAALRKAPTEWFTRPSRGPDWPFDLDRHSAEHRLKDIQRALTAAKR